MAQQQKVKTRVNGIDTQVLQKTIDAIKADPDLGTCRFRARNRWMRACQNRSTIDGYYAAKQEHSHIQRYPLEADEPPLLAGDDQAPNPVEHLLHALASCVTTSLVAHAAVRGIELAEIESELEGDIDLRGFLGLDPKVPKGYTAIRVTFRVKTDERDLKRLKELTQFSPVFSTITQGAKVSIDIVRK